MRQWLLLGVGGALMLGGCTTTSVMTSPSRPSYMPIGAAVDGPKGYADMCASMRRSLCATQTAAIAHHKRAFTTQLAAYVQPAPAKPAPVQAAEARITLAVAQIPAPQIPAFQTPAAATAAPAPLAPIAEPDAPHAVGGAGPARFDTAAPTSAILSAPERAIAFAGPQAAAPAPAASGETDDAWPLERRLAQLRAVNRNVNDHVVQRTDLANYGVEEFWTRSGVGRDGAGRDASGDCEDLAIEKRWELIEQGYPTEDLFYAVAYRHGIGLHVVLVAHTEVGDLILDSRSPYITAWDRAPYDWVKRQLPGDETHWALIGAPPAPTAPRDHVTVAELDPHKEAQATSADAPPLDAATGGPSR